MINNLNDIISLIILAFIIYNVSMGFRKGIISQLAWIVNTILALAAAPILMPAFHQVINNLNAQEEIAYYIQKYLDAYTYSHSAEALSSLGLNSDTATIGLDNIARRIIEQSANNISVVAAGNVIKVISYGGAFFVIKAVLHFTLDITRLISSLPIIKPLDRFLGGICGGVMSIISLWIIIALIKLLTFMPEVETLYSYIQSIPILSIVSSINPFQLLIKSIDYIKK